MTLATQAAALAAAEAKLRRVQDAFRLRRSKANEAKVAAARASHCKAVEAARAAIDAHAVAETRAQLAAGATLDPFRPSDASFVATLRKHVGDSPESTCGHSLTETLEPVRWTPRAPDRLLCGRCEAEAPPLTVPDTCDQCHARPAIGWRSFAIPAGPEPRSLTAPVSVFLRLCEACE